MKGGIGLRQKKALERIINLMMTYHSVECLKEKICDFLMHNN